MWVPSNMLRVPTDLRDLPRSVLWGPRHPPHPSPWAPQDVKRCLSALEELGTLQVTSQILQKNTDVVATLKKVGGDGMGWLWAGPPVVRVVPPLSR